MNLRDHIFIFISRNIQLALTSSIFVMNGEECPTIKPITALRSESFLVNNTNILSSILILLIFIMKANSVSERNSIGKKSLKRMQIASKMWKVSSEKCLVGKALIAGDISGILRSEYKHI